MTGSAIKGEGGGRPPRHHLDILLNVAASILSLGTIQLLALPLLSRSLSPADYGLMLLLTGAMNAIGVALGNPLNNTRLLLHRKYTSLGGSGDFALIASICAGVVFVMVLTVAVLIAPSGNWPLWGTIALAGLSVFSRAYYSVAFRLLLNFRHILRSSIAGVFGCVAGLAVNHILDFWPIVFLLAEAGQLAYTIRHSFVWRERPRRSELMKSVSRRFGTLAAAGLISAAMPYLDRFLLFPALGASEVSVFVVASYLGKVAGGLAMPVAGVLLAHDIGRRAGSRALLFRRLLLILAVCAVVYLFVALADSFILEALFPSLIASAESYLNLANAGAIVGIAGTLLNPTILRFSPLRYQVLIQGVHLTSFLTLGLLGIHIGGLAGFCWGVLASNAVRLIAMILVGLFAVEAERAS